MSDNIPKLSLVKRDDEWWITGIPNSDVPEYGPYATKLLADEDRVGLLRTYKYQDVAGFVTTERRRRTKTKPEAPPQATPEPVAAKRRQTKLF